MNMNLDKFSYNVLIANLHEIYNFFNKMTDGEKLNKNLKDNYIKMLKVMQPIIPHIALECLKEVSPLEKSIWPTINEKYLKIKKNIIIIQINGKKRGLLTTEDILDENSLIASVKKSKELNKFIENKKIIKTIFIKNKLINFIAK
tara:strand:- start:68 stop:502 length:435 start_codon:yes stop_codon:yes gene_type:complete